MSARVETIVLVAICQVLSITAQLSLKLGTRNASHLLESPLSFLRFAFRPWLWLGGGLYLFGMILWTRVLSMVDLSFAYPFVAIAYVGVILCSQWLLHERVSLRRWAGLGIILLGLAFVVSSGTSTAG